MKPFWISVSFLTAMIALLLWNAHHLQGMILPLQDRLTLAARYAEAGDWDGATQMTKEIEEALEKKSLYLHTTLPHAELDQLFLLLEQAQSFLRNETLGEYHACNQSIIRRMSLLYEMENLSLRNLL